VPAGFFVLVSVAILSMILIRAQREEMLAEVVHGSESIAQAILLSLDRDMRLNRREELTEIIEAVGGHEGIHEIRLFNKDGVVSYSSDPGEVGRTVDTRADACVQCHAGEAPPPPDVDPRGRTRRYEGEDGENLLATIHVVRNQEGCQGARCHVAPSEQSVLGVLDVAMSLEPAEARLAAATRHAIFVALAAVAIITGVLFLLIRSSVQRPIDRMIAATRRVAVEDPSLSVPRGSAREIGILASSINDMVESLASSKSRVEEWAGTLEDKVAAKAQELREAQFQVIRAEKLSSVGLVAAGIAHELNSPLMAIITFTHVVRNALPEDSQSQEDLRMIEREANRCAAIIRQLLDYSRKQSQEPETSPTAVAPLVDRALELLKVEIKNNRVVTSISMPEHLPPVEASEVQLMQVVVNLVLNAVQAMPDGGELQVRGDVVPRGAFPRADLPPHSSDSLLRIRFRDTGPGIPRHDIGRVFDPFFTTKDVGKGSGLGLSVSLGLVRGYRGTIFVESDGESWSEFSVLLPISDADLPEVTP
jgi:two-component system NtrC family sensor kinase